MTRGTVVVVGGGNAGLCAAIEARLGSADVVLLERAPDHMRGGNSRHTRDIRCAHDRPDPYAPGAYPVDEFEEDLRRVTGGGGDRDLAHLTISRSASLADWMTKHGVRWQKPLRGTLHLNRTNRFFLGGGKAMVNAYYDTAKKLGVRVAYDAKVVGIQVKDGSVSAVEIERGNGVDVLACGALVLAAGGFEANKSWLREYWGDAARNYVIRGTPFNDGIVLRLLLDLGAEAIGDPRQFHATAVDARAPEFDGGVCTRLDSVPFGIVVNSQGDRFYDEGEDLWPKRYAIWGGLIARQPGQIAYSITDAKSDDLYLPSLYPPLRSSTIEGLAAQVGLDPQKLRQTVDTFNHSTAPDGPFDPTRLDGVSTRGIAPSKSNWARAIDTPPYTCFALRPGITFTYMGVRVDAQAHALKATGTPVASNLFVAGELMAGNILSKGYLAGFGLTIGSVFGRIAGTEAAYHCLS